MMSGSKGQNTVRACTIRCLTLGPAKYEKVARDRIMNENLIVEDNTIYEIDPECLKRKREREARKKSEEKLKNDAEYRKNQR